MATTSDGHLKYIEPIAQEDAAGLLTAHKSYGSSWKKRGGIGAYIVMIRKIDRMERQVERYGYDVIKAVEADQRPEGLIDDIRDARRYLMLIESWMREMGLAKAGDHRDNIPEGGCADCEIKTGCRGECGANDNMPGITLSKKAEGDVLLQTDRVKQPIKTTQLKCIAHIPDAICECSRCQAMVKLAKQPHIKDCGCENCVGVKESVKATVGRLKREAIEKQAEVLTARRGKTLHIQGKSIDTGSAEYAQLEMRRQYHHREICSGSDCDDPAHAGLVQDQFKAEAAERQRKLYEDNPHPLQCGCDMCLAEHDGPCSHDCSHPACKSKRARGDHNG